MKRRTSFVDTLGLPPVILYALCLWLSAALARRPKVLLLGLAILVLSSLYLLTPRAELRPSQISAPDMADGWDEDGPLPAMPPEPRDNDEIKDPPPPRPLVTRDPPPPPPPSPPRLSPPPFAEHGISWPRWFFAAWLRERLMSMIPAGRRADR